MGVKEGQGKEKHACPFPSLCFSCYSIHFVKKVYIFKLIDYKEQNE